jgi:hypothetical protein
VNPDGLHEAGNQARNRIGSGNCDTVCPLCREDLINCETVPASAPPRRHSLRIQVSD